MHRRRRSRKGTARYLSNRKDHIAEHTTTDESRKEMRQKQNKKTFVSCVCVITSGCG